MKISFSSLACTNFELEKIIELAVANNYDGVELRAKIPHLSLDDNLKKRKTIKKMFQKSKLKIPCITAYTRFGYQDNNTRQNNINQLKKVIDLAADIGADYVRTFGPDPDNTFKIEKVIDWIRESFLAIDNYAGKRDVKVLLESHDDLSRGEELIKIFKDDSLNNCGILWDVAHSIRAGEEIEKTIDYISGYIYHVHLKDWINLSNKKDHYVLLGAGELKIKKLLDNLQKINYNGYLSLEWEKLWHPEIEDSKIAIRQYSKKMGSFLKYY